MRIEEVMCRDVQHCSPEDSLESAARLMWEHDCGCAPVCTGDGEQRVVGMITDRDISMCALFQGKPLSQLKVRDAMSRDVGSCRPADDTSRVERLMSERQVRRVPVVNEEGNLVGIVSLADLVRHAKPRNSRAPGRVTESEIRETLASICAPSRSEETPSAMVSPAAASERGLSPSH
jgi:CBS domain-containing protein